MRIQVSVIAIAMGLAVAFGCGPQPQSAVETENTSEARLTFTGSPIVGLQSNRCVDINAMSTADGTQAQLWDCNGGTNQSWTYNSGQQLVVYGNKCLQASGGGTSNLTPVVIGPCTGQAHQQWNVNSDGTITGVQSGLCMDANGAATGNGTKIILWTCGASDNQKWTVPGIGGGSARKSLIDYFKPTPIISALTSNTWGAPNVLPRDTSNGLEDKTLNQWVYWDGKIIRAPDGKYHLFGSRWDQSGGHWAWGGSQAIHAVSESSPLGPYVDKGLAFTDNGGRGHNVTAGVLTDGRYCLLVSETRPASIYLSSSLDGPWTFQGAITIDGNGYSTDGTQSNVSMTVRPDGSILMVSRHGIIMLSTTGIMGPYKVQGPTVYPDIPNRNFANAEDPVIWYSGGKYHITYNYWDSRVAYHLVSPDGIHGWVNAGVAYDPTMPFVRYTDGTVNMWRKIERPGVLIEDGHVTHFTFAAIDVEKEQDLGNDNHGSKIIVVPFDGALFDADGGGTN